MKISLLFLTLPLPLQNPLTSSPSPTSSYFSKLLYVSYPPDDFYRGWLVKNAFPPIRNNSNFFIICKVPRTTRTMVFKKFARISACYQSLRLKFVILQPIFIGFTFKQYSCNCNNLQSTCPKMLHILLKLSAIISSCSIRFVGLN